jgi:hypothetical protein
MPAVSRQRYTSPRIVRLIDRIRGLVAEQRRLERAGARDLVDALALEITRLQTQLANMVRSELAAGHGPGGAPA